MLTLQRKNEEEIYIVLPDDRIIKIQVLKIKNKLVSLGFDGPLDIRIDRKEIHELRKANV